MFLLFLPSCAVSKVVTKTTCDSSENDLFYFKVFRFPGETTGDEVYFRASVIVCLAESKASVCQNECGACRGSRNRRDTLEENQQTEFYVTAGPFKIRDPDQGV